MSIFPAQDLSTPTQPVTSPFVVPSSRKSAGRAWLFSLLLPGSGQLYTGGQLRGALTMLCFLVAMAAIIFVETDARWLGVRVAVMFYAFATYDAYETAREYNAGIEPDGGDNPRVAALLNLTTNGFGYVYLGHRWGWGVFIFMFTLGRLLAKALPLAAEILVAGFAIHAWRIAQVNRDTTYPPHLRPATKETRLPRPIPVLVSGAVMGWYYAFVILGQIVLLRNAAVE